MFPGGSTAHAPLWRDRKKEYWNGPILSTVDFGGPRYGSSANSTSTWTDSVTRGLALPFSPMAPARTP